MIVISTTGNFKLSEKNLLCEHDHKIGLIKVAFKTVRAMVFDCFSLEPAWFEQNLKLEPLTKQRLKPLYSKRFINFVCGSSRFVREPFRNNLEPPRNAYLRYFSIRHHKPIGTLSNSSQQMRVSDSSARDRSSSMIRPV